MMIDDNRKIGMGLCALGLLLIFLGCVFLFDRALLTLGNLGFLAGLVFLLGPEKTTKFFVKKTVPSLIFFSGIVVIIYGWPFVGFCLEVYGVWKLFATFLPNVVATLKMLPGVAQVLETPPFSYACDYINDNRRLPV
mmetsp:Transcript_8717/g.21145  ORF Transcript_8717/g.21145 Transcript_8717/m.21145 type:complete len:137 (+) Transcript_8717:163-573(+)